MSVSHQASATAKLESGSEKAEQLTSKQLDVIKALKGRGYLQNGGLNSNMYWQVEKTSDKPEDRYIPVELWNKLMPWTRDGATQYLEFGRIFRDAFFGDAYFRTGKYSVEVNVIVEGLGLVLQGRGSKSGVAGSYSNFGVAMKYGEVPAVAALRALQDKGIDISEMPFVLSPVNFKGDNKIEMNVVRGELVGVEHHEALPAGKVHVHDFNYPGGDKVRFHAYRFEARFKLHPEITLNDENIKTVVVVGNNHSMIEGKNEHYRDYETAVLPFQNAFIRKTLDVNGFGR